MLPDINLLPKYQRENSLAYTLFIFGFVVCFLLFAMLIFFYFNTEGNLEETKDDLNQLNQEKAIVEDQLASLNMSPPAEAFEAALTYAEHHIVPTSFLIDELITILPEQGYLSNFNYNYQYVDMETQFETRSDTAAYVSALLHADYVMDVKVNEMNTFEFGLQEAEEAESDGKMSRYNVSYSVEVNQSYLREVGESDEESISGE